MMTVNIQSEHQTIHWDRKVHTFYVSTFWWRNWNILGEPDQSHGCWCPGSTKCVTRSLTSMILNMHSKRVLVFHERGLQLPAPCHCWEKIKAGTNMVLSLPQEFTHWGRVMHFCISTLGIIGSDNGFLPGWHQVIIWTNAGILIIGPLGTNFSEIYIEMYTSSFKKIHLKISSGNWQPFCLHLNVLTVSKEDIGVECSWSTTQNTVH